MNKMNPEALLQYFKENLSDDEYDINENGEFCVLKKEKSAISNFSLIPIEVIKQVTDDGEIRPYKYIFAGILNNGDCMTTLNKMEVLSKDLGNRKWLSTQNPLCIFYRSSTTGFKTLLQFILKSQKKVPVKIEYGNSGWNKYEDKWIYVHSGGGIGADEKVSAISKESFLQMDDGVQPKEAFVESLNMIEICNPKLTHTLLCLTLNSIITTPLMKTGLSPNYSLWIYGKSGLGKTSLSKLFTQIFEVNKFVQVYDYKKDIKKTAMNRDCVSIIDDYGTAKTKQTEYRMDEKVEEIIRWAGDREISSNYTVRPEGMILFTGESFLTLNTKNASSIARIIRVEMDNLFNKREKNYDPIKVQKFEYHCSKPFLSTSIGHYLKWLSEKMNSQFLVDYRHDYMKIKREIQDTVHERHVDSIAHLIVSYNFYLSYGREKEFITPEQFSSFSNTAKEIFMEILLDQNIPVIDPNVDLFLKTLEKLIVEGKIIVHVKGAPSQMNITPLGVLDRDQHILSFAWQTVYDIVINDILATNNEISYFISDKKLGKLLRDYKMIYLHGDERTTKPVAGLEGRAIQFRTDMFKELVAKIIDVDKNSKLNWISSQLAKEHEGEHGFHSIKGEKKLRKEIKKISKKFI